MRLDLSVTPTPPGQEKQIDSLTKLLHGKKKIVVIAGAGISVSAGSMLSCCLVLKRGANVRSSGFPIQRRPV